MIDDYHYKIGWVYVADQLRLQYRAECLTHQKNYGGYFLWNLSVAATNTLSFN